MPNNKRQTTTYNKVVAITSNDEIIVIQDTFDYGDGFKGATYYSMRPLSEEQIQNQKEEDFDVAMDLWKEAVASGQTTKSASEFQEDLMEEIELDPERYTLTDDPSFRVEFDKVLEDLLKSRPEWGRVIDQIKGGDFKDWNCESCGRVGNSCEDWKTAPYIVDPNLLDKVCEVEKR